LHSRTRFPKFPLPENAAAKFGELRSRLINSPALQDLLERLRPVIERALTEVRAQLDKHPEVASGLRKAARLARRPSRLALGTAAAAVLTAGIVTSVTVGAAAPAASAVATDAVGHGGPAVTSQAHVPAHSAPAAPAGQPSAPSGHAAAPSGHAAAPSGHAVTPSGHAATPAAQPSAPSGHAATKPAPPAPAKPYLIYDSTTPSGIPAQQHVVATYADGPHPVSPSQVNGRDKVMWIDINGSDTKASVLDVEPGDATPSGAAAWAKAKLASDPNGSAIIYTMLSDWSAVRGAVSALPSGMQSHVHYWIADPTGHPHIVPGSAATQWYWGPNYDISSASPGF
jgi:hypothetical protein